WAGGAVGEEEAATLEDAAQAALESSEEDSLENLTVEQVLDYINDVLESQEEDEGSGEEESETETDSNEPGEGKDGDGDSPDIRSIVRET
ncbi:MAG: hypothetical protein SXQ77_08845, partial [Halobacteria archaeon]|nr:hypothetical protein [Halobacteria archaeon]